MAGGSRNYADMYSKYKQDSASDADFEKYVDSQGDLNNAWTLIDAYNKGEDVDTKFAGQYQHPAGLSPSQQAEYWQKRGATSKSAFGRSHAAEDQALRTGSYQGSTDVRKGTDAYKDYFDSKDTRFTQYIQDPNRGNGNGNGNGNGTTSTWAAATGGGAPGSAMYPMGLVDYEAPSAMSGIPLEFQPWLQAENMPDSLWNYQPPTLDEWEIARNWDWASKPASEYAPKPPVTTATTTQQHAPEGGADNVEQSDGWDDAYAEYGSYPGDPAGRVAKPGVGTPSVMDILSGLLD